MLPQAKAPHRDTELHTCVSPKVIKRSEYYCTAKQAEAEPD